MRSGIAYVQDGLDSLLAKHGYERKENYYNALHPNEYTIALFCHFGVECVMLGHLLGISPMLLWHGFMAAPTSVTTVCFELQLLEIFLISMFMVSLLHLPDVSARCTAILNRDTTKSDWTANIK